jgi:hypothetical protein
MCAWFSRRGRPKKYSTSRRSSGSRFCPRKIVPLGPTRRSANCEFGVPNIWVIDPKTFEAEIHTVEGSCKVDDGILRVPGAPIEVPLEVLDRD